MNSIKVKELMVPLSEYNTVTGTESLQEMFEKLDSEVPDGLSRPHRDVLVVDNNGDLRGKVSILDLFKALEPSYGQMEANDRQHVLTGEYVKKIFNEYDLWSSSMKDVCSRGAALKVEDIMHTPAAGEFIQADETLDMALHAFIMGVHQPLIVLDGKRVLGVLRLGDVFDKLRESIKVCKL